MTVLSNVHDLERPVKTETTKLTVFQAQYFAYTNKRNVLKFALFQVFLRFPPPDPVLK
jgi:hypothetical protein